MQENARKHAGYVSGMPAPAPGHGQMVPPTAAQPTTSSRGVSSGTLSAGSRGSIHPGHSYAHGAPPAAPTNILPASASSRSSSASSAMQQRRSSNSSSINASAVDAAKSRVSTASTAAAAPAITSKPTPTPTASEGHLSLQRQAAAPSAATPLSPSAATAPLVGAKLQGILQQLDPTWTLDAAAEEQLLQLADDFLEKLCRTTFRLAQHRGSKTVDVADVQLALAKCFNIVIPGLGPPPTVASASKAKVKGHVATSHGHHPVNTSKPPSSSKRKNSSASASTPGGTSAPSSGGSGASGGAGQPQQPPTKMSKNLSGAAVPAG
jgi:Transcription initiation factor TFIID subunit A